MEERISERRKAFAAAHRSDEDRQTHISASRRASSVIAKAKAKAWQTTCSSLSPKSNPKSVYFLLHSVATSSSSSFPFSNFPKCSSPREYALVYAAYLRSHFSISQPKTLRSRATDYLSEPRRATCPEESHSSFFPAEFLVAASNLSSSTATGQKSCLSHSEAPSSLCHRFSFSHFQSLLDFAFLSFHLKGIFYYSHPQDGKASRFSCFLMAYLFHLLRLKAV